MNPARKLSRIIGRLPPPNGKPAQESWLKVFANENADRDSVNDLHHISACLSLMNKQIDELDAALESKQIPKEMYKPQLGSLRSAILPTRNKEAWQQIHTEIGKDTPLMLLWAGYTLGGPIFDEFEEEIHGLLTTLDDLEEQLKDNSLPDSVKELIRRNASEIRNAINAMETEGASSLKGALNAAYVELACSKQEIREAFSHGSADDKKVINRFAGLLQKTIAVIQKTGESADAISKIIKLGNNISELLERAPS